MLSQKGIGKTRPNPIVGAVIVKNALGSALYFCNPEFKDKFFRCMPLLIQEDVKLAMQKIEKLMENASSEEKSALEENVSNACSLFMKKVDAMVETGEITLYSDWW